MGRIAIILLAAIAVVTAAGLEARLGATGYELNGVRYAVPHKYELMRQFYLPWLDHLKGLAPEPPESVGLLFPAGELELGIPGYRKQFHGYVSEVPADMVVNVLGGREAREFSSDRLADLAKVSKELRGSSPQQPDKTTGWTRVYWLVGEKGTTGEGGSLFYLIPAGGPEQLPEDWRVPSCQGSPDANKQETYDCHFSISRNGLTFDFMLRQENLNLADDIPEYVRTRLKAWRRST